MIIEDHVLIGAGTRIMANAYLTGHTEIGRDNLIHMGAVIGHEPQDTRFERGTRSFTRIGDRNIFREYCTVHRGTQPDSATVIGDDNFLMASSHVGHNCEVGNRVVICNAALLGGHVRIGDRAFISGGVVIHQFILVGSIAMCSGNARVTMDVPPFLTTAERNEIYGLNLVGMKRAGLAANSVAEIKKLYKLFYRSGYSFANAIKEAAGDGSFVTPEAANFIAFIRNSPNGVCHATRD